MKQERQEAIRSALRAGRLSVSGNGTTIIGQRGKPIGSRSKLGHWQLSVPAGRLGDSFGTSFATVIWIDAYGRIPEGKIISYRDGDTSNHRLENLYLTDRQARARELGEQAGRTRQARQQLTDEQVAALKREKAEYPERTQAELAQKYGVSRSCISNILAGRKRR